MEPPRPSPPRSFRDGAGVALKSVSIRTLVVVAASVTLVAGGGYWLVRTPPLPVEQQLPRAPVASSSVSGFSVSVASPTTIVVQISGAVVVPGVYHLPTGSRVRDLVHAAGGPTPEADVNELPLAQRLIDGQRVVLARPGEASTAGSSVSGVGSDPPGADSPIDINAASLEQLQSLPGVGPATASAIVAYREQHGPFRSVDGLLEVHGIGNAKFDGLRDLVTVA